MVPPFGKGSLLALSHGIARTASRSGSKGAKIRKENRRKKRSRCRIGMGKVSLQPVRHSGNLLAQRYHCRGP
ncbi:MAG: hypothetical protein C4576_08325 [Desulfobacteraceae bacterium]|nr:MAG: hypothetical protein C4576_08325 [Desulfobacteraceae bacterium]